MWPLEPGGRSEGPDRLETTILWQGWVVVRDSFLEEVVLGRILKDGRSWFGSQGGDGPHRGWETLIEAQQEHRFLLVVQRRLRLRRRGRVW